MKKKKKEQKKFQLKSVKNVFSHLLVHNGGKGGFIVYSRKEDKYI